MFIFTLFFLSTFSAQRNCDGKVEEHSEGNQQREEQGEHTGMAVQRLEEMLQVEGRERGRLELEMEKLRQEKEILEEERKRERGRSLSMEALHLLAMRRNGVVMEDIFYFIQIETTKALTHLRKAKEKYIHLYSLLFTYLSGSFI